MSVLLICWPTNPIRFHKPQERLRSENFIFVDIPTQREDSGQAHRLIRLDQAAADARFGQGACVRTIPAIRHKGPDSPKLIRRRFATRKMPNRGCTMPSVGVPGSRHVSDGRRERPNQTDPNEDQYSDTKDGFGQHSQLIPRG
jgi:hypothetical protein